MKKRLLAVFMALCLTVGMLPVSIAAFSESYDIGDHDVEISGDNCDCSADDPHVITGESIYGFFNISPNDISVSGKHYIKLNNVTVEKGLDTAPAIKINDGADVTLILEGSNTLSGGTYNAGIYVAENAQLTIQGDGTLYANGGAAAAGIGGSRSNQHCGHITIKSGNVYAQGGTEIGGMGAAGIGSGYATGGTCSGSITINGGYVSAKGGTDAAGIGGGENVGGCNVTINGGIVYAQGNDSPSIGGGHLGIGNVDNGTFSTGAGGHGVIIAPQGIGAPSSANTWDGIFINRGDENSAEESNGMITLRNDAVVIGSPDVGDLIVSTGITLTIFGGQTVGENLGGHTATVDIAPAEFTLAAGATLTNNGTIQNNGHLILWGTAAGTGHLVNNGTVSVPLTEDMVTFSESSPVTYDSLDHKVSVTEVKRQIWDQSVSFTEKDNYTVTAPNGAEAGFHDAGTYTYTISPKDDQTTPYRLLNGKITKDFVIQPKTVTVSVPPTRQISNSASNLLAALPKIGDMGVSANGIIQGDDAVVSLTWSDTSGTITSDRPVPSEGSQSYNWIAVLTGTQLGNYTLSPENGTTTVTVTKDTVADVVIGGLTVQDGKYEITYGDRVMETPNALTVSLKDHDGVTIPTDAITWSIENNNCKISGQNVATIDSIGNLTISNAGTAAIKVTVSRFEENGVWYAGGTGQIQLIVNQKALTASLTGPGSVTYTGSSDVTLTEDTDYTINGYVLNDNTHNEVNVTATGKLDHPSAGSQTLSVDYTVAGAKAGNYTAPAADNKVITVNKATLTPNTGSVTVQNRKAATYTYSLDQLLPGVTAPATLGVVTYEAAAVTQDSNSYITAATIDNTKKTLTVTTNNVNSAVEGHVATIQVTIKSTNYQDMTATLEVNAINPGTVTLTYFPNGGVGAGQTHSYDQGTSTTAMGNMFSRDYYVFTGWNTAANGSGTAYAPGAAITLNGNMELYAQWRYVGGNSGSGSSDSDDSDDYTLYYHSNFGNDKRFYQSEDTNRMKVRDYDDMSFLPQRDGYIFLCWNTKEDGSGTDYQPGDTFRLSGSTDHLYAQWKNETYAPDDTGVSSWLNVDDHNAYLSGYGNGTFGPDNNMTRAQVAQMFYNLLLNKDVPITAVFSDVPADAWYATAVNTLASLGIVNGIGNGQFAPDRTITRAEFTVIAMRFTNGDISGESIFSDVSADDWFYDQVVGSVQYGWINGFGDGTFRPNKTISRAEVTTIVNRMLGRSADEDYADRHTADLWLFQDVDKDYWAYYQIVEATNAHDYTKEGTTESWINLS